MTNESPPSLVQKLHLRRTFEQTRTRTERWSCYARAAFGTAVLVRFLHIRAFEADGLNGTGVWVNSTCITMMVTASLIEARYLRRASASLALLTFSIAVDASGCFVSLAQDVLWPAQARATSYTGVLAHPDICAQLVVVMASPLRLSAPLAVLSGGLNLGFAGALLALDHARWGGFRGYVQQEIGLYVVCLVAVTVLAVIAAAGCRRLVFGLHEAHFRVQCARTNLASLASDHHDVKSLLSAALLHTDMLGEHLSKQASTPDHEVARLRRISSDLARLSTELEKLCERTFTEMTLLRASELVRTAQVLPQTARALQLRFPSLAIRLSAREPVDTRLVGGAVALERVLYNLVANAHKGDGTRGAARVVIEAETIADRLHLAVHDDGPGFPGGERVSALSTKARGSGVGLQLVTQLIRASDGRVDLGQSAWLGGALVRLELPSAGSSSEVEPSWTDIGGRAHRARSR